ncbi:exosome non-catalytic core subunit rrp46 [Pichia californica]|uniref:Exosome non-catalytic core subunit rrp46 n=1 Tax=Pichia californica TaxID=460514 RepID=A0A9P7BHX5_9ASCO|nr:exosome non-catalytic core subunit rrp46 [[Candida] californica]KAG0690664.1 exosome non-catalytic core subunit rrp46 [[Candida] californica]
MSAYTAKQNILQQVDGSATFQFSTTKIISSITGPIEVARPRNEKPTEAFLSISVRPSTGTPTTREAFLEVKLKKILSCMINMEQYPLSEIQIVVQILESGEREQFTCMELACAVNSLYLALLNAGISLKASFLSSFCASKDDNIIVRPTKEELDTSTANHLSVFSISDGKADELIYSDSIGKTTETELFSALAAISSDVNKINETVREVILQSVVDDYVWKF